MIITQNVFITYIIYDKSMIIFHKSNFPWLVLWNIFIFHILGIIIPTDFHIFQRSWNHQAEMFGVQSTYSCSNHFTINSKKLLIKWIKLQLLMLCLINPTIPQLLINSQHSPIVDVWGTIPAFFRRFSRPTCLVASDSPCLRAAFASRPLGRSLISTTVWPVI